MAPRNQTDLLLALDDMTGVGGVEEVILRDKLYAIVVRRDFHRPGIHFFTPDEFSEQLGYLSHPSGHVVRPHVHREVRRDVRRTQEVLILRKGRMRVDFYGSDTEYVGSREIEAGDIILLVDGGHGLEVLEDCEMFEIKQGPYDASQDKSHFTPRTGPAAERDSDPR
jgi:hypothetical protein